MIFSHQRYVLSLFYRYVQAAIAWSISLASCFNGQLGYNGSSDYHSRYQ